MKTRWIVMKFEHNTCIFSHILNSRIQAENYLLNMIVEEIVGLGSTQQERATIADKFHKARHDLISLLVKSDCIVHKKFTFMLRPYLDI